MIEQDISAGNLSEVIGLVDAVREGLINILDKCPSSEAIERAKQKSLLAETKDYIPNEYVKLLFTLQLQLASFLKDSKDEDVFISLKDLIDPSFPLEATPQTIKSIAKVEKHYNGDISQPKLPPIRSATIRSQVFTHKSSFEKYLTGNGVHNGKLAFLGESILRTCASNILLHNLIRYDENELFVLRSKITSDSQLEKWVELYRLNDDEAYLTNSSLKHIKNSPYADLFKAYIAGLSEDGYSTKYIESWLSTLIVPLIKKYYIKGQDRNSLQNASIDELLSFVDRSSFVTYLTVHTDPYAVNVLIDGNVCGNGTASDLMRAKQRAALDALRNLAKKSKVKATQSEKVPSETKTDAENDDPVVISAKNDLYALLNKQSLVPHYEIRSDGFMFCAVVKCKDVKLGEGKDKSKKFASQRAAMAALKNRLAIAKLLS